MESTKTKAWHSAPVRPRRVLFFGKRKARTCCTGALVEGLRQQGVEVRWVRCSFYERYLGTAGMRLAVRSIRKRFDPDLCFVFFHDLPPPLMEEFSKEIPTVVWMEELTHTDAEHIDYVKHVRLLCLSAPSMVHEYRERGIEQATFLPSAFSPQYHKPVLIEEPVQYDRDIAFIGGPGVMGDRPEFLAWLARHHDLEIFGRPDTWLPHLHRHPRLRFGHEVRPVHYGEICARSKIVLGLNQDHDSFLYLSNRLFLTLACRGFHLTHYVPGIEQLFGDGEHLAWFRSREECLAQISRYLENDAERLRNAGAGHVLVSSSHRYEDRIKDIFAILALEKDLDFPRGDVHESSSSSAQPVETA